MHNNNYYCNNKGDIEFFQVCENFDVICKQFRKIHFFHLRFRYFGQPQSKYQLSSKSTNQLPSQITYPFNTKLGHFTKWK